MFLELAYFVICGSMTALLAFRPHIGARHSRPHLVTAVFALLVVRILVRGFLLTSAPGASSSEAQIA
jgi:hypothetical protein